MFKEEADHKSADFSALSFSRVFVCVKFRPLRASIQKRQYLNKQSIDYDNQIIKIRYYLNDNMIHRFLPFKVWCSLGSPGRWNSKISWTFSKKTGSVSHLGLFTLGAIQFCFQVIFSLF